MIELVLKNYLSSALDVPVYPEMPENPPDKIVLFEKTGSGSENFIDNATFAIQSYAPTLFEAAELNETVKNAMSDMAMLNEVFSCELNSDYNFTDTATKKYRYQAVFDITYKEDF